MQKKKQRYYEPNHVSTSTVCLILKPPTTSPAPRSNAQQHHLTQVSACHKRSKIGVIMKRKLGIHSMHPYHDSTLIKVMMANGQQLQPMHALFSSIPLGELEVSHSLFSWEEVRGGQQHMYTSHSGLNTTATPHR